MASRSRRRRESGEPVPVASFSDIAFLLIIFFILVTSLAKPVGFSAELPSGEKSETQSEEKSNIVNLHDGSIRFNDQATDLDRLEQNLRVLQLHDKEGNDRVIMLEATGVVPYQLYYEVMLTITNAGGVIGIVREDN